MLQLTTSVRAAWRPGQVAGMRAIITTRTGVSRDVTARVVWRSNDPAVATIDAAGVVVAQGGGTTRILAQFGSSEATRDLTVEGPLPDVYDDCADAFNARNEDDLITIYTGEGRLLSAACNHSVAGGSWTEATEAFIDTLTARDEAMRYWLWTNGDRWLRSPLTPNIQTLTARIDAPRMDAPLGGQWYAGEAGESWTFACDDAPVGCAARADFNDATGDFIQDARLWLRDEPCVPDKGSLISDGEFSRLADGGAQCWFGWNQMMAWGGFSEDFDDHPTPTAEPALTVDFPVMGDWPWQTQLIYEDMPVLAGGRYRLSFWARAAEARPIDVLVHDQWDGLEAFAEHITLDAQWTLIEREFVATSGSMTMDLEFRFAQYATSAVWLDDVALQFIGPSIQEN